MRVLVTGGAGFIGSHLVEALVKQRDEVIVLDDLSTGFEENLESVRNNIEFINGNISDYGVLKDAMKDVEIVFHQAASRSVLRSMENPLETNEVNVTGTLKVMLASKESGVRKVVFASSSSVYGDAVEKRKFKRQKENQRPWPVSPYAVSKLSAESYTLAYARIYQIGGIALRYFNVFGPRQRPNSPYAAVIPVFMEAAFHKHPIEVHGTGRQSRDFTYIDNVVQANLLAAKEKSIKGDLRGIFNVAVGENYSVLDLISELEKITKHEFEIKHTASRPGDVPKTWADISETRKKLGYKPKVNFSTGLRQTWQWFLSAKQKSKR